MVLDLVGGEFPFWVYPLLVWTIFWKARASWDAARNNQVVWFISFWVLNTLGILPLVYLIWFRKDKKVKCEKSGKKIRKRIRKKTGRKVNLEVRKKGLKKKV